MSLRQRPVQIVFAAGLLAAAGARAQVTQDNFVLGTTADLVALCNASPSDPLYTAAANFCHGFVVGTYRALAAVAPAEAGRKLFCGPAHIPSRNEAVGGFLAWAAKQTNLAQLSATDGFGEYLMATYPCAS